MTCLQLPCFPGSGPDFRTCVLLQFGMRLVVVFGQAKCAPHLWAMGTSPLLLGEHPCLAPGWLTPPCPPLPGRGSKKRMRATLLAKYSSVSGQLPPGWLVPVFVMPGSLFLRSRSRQAAAHMVGRRQRVRWGAGSAAPAPSAGSSPARRAAHLLLPACVRAGSMC